LADGTAYTEDAPKVIIASFPSATPLLVLIDRMLYNQNIGGGGGQTFFGKEIPGRATLVLGRQIWLACTPIYIGKLTDLTGLYKYLYRYR
jgi:hypothetical protein